MCSFSLAPSFAHTLWLPRASSEKPLEPIAMAYLLCIMGCSVPEDWLGWEERLEEKVESGEADKGEFFSHEDFC